MIAFKRDTILEYIPLFNALLKNEENYFVFILSKIEDKEVGNCSANTIEKEKLLFWMLFKLLTGYSVWVVSRFMS